jgi:hypothetical protein
MITIGLSYGNNSDTLKNHFSTPPDSTDKSTISKYRYCFRSAIGIGSMAIGNIGGNLYIDKSILSINLELGIAEHLFVSPSEENATAAFLIGRSITNDDISQFDIFTGIGYSGIIKKGKQLEQQGFGKRYEKLCYNTISVPISLEFTFRKYKYMSLGFNFIGNINRYISYFGVTICLKIGKIE